MTMLKNTKTCRAVARAAAALGLSLLPGVASACDDPPELQIVAFTYGGTGCPAGSVTIHHDPASDMGSVDFEMLETTLPQGLSSACSMTFQLRAPPHFQVSLERVEYMGHVDADLAVGGELLTRYKSGDQPPVSFVKDFAPGASGDFDVVDENPGAGVCEEQVTILMNFRVDLHGTPSGASTSSLRVTKVAYRFRLGAC